MAVSMRLLLLVVVSISSIRGAVGQCVNGKCPGGQCCKISSDCEYGGIYCDPGPGRCFPGDAVVYVSPGESKLMGDLEIGDKIAVYNDKELSFEEIYAFGHKTSEPFSEFVELVAVGIDGGSVTTLELTSKHFVLTIDHSGSVQHKRAEDVHVGDIVLAMNASLSKPLPHVITSKAMVHKFGLYKPYTLSGTIIVNNVVASAHSGWFLDGIFYALAIPHMLPAAYQALLSPARALFYILGKDTYVLIYSFLGHQNLVAAAFGTEYGGTIAAAAVVASILSLYKASSKINVKA